VPEARKNQTEKRVLIVLGMHRSGTSAATRVLNLCGADLPQTLMQPRPDNPAGFWESEPIARLTEQILGKVGLRWDDVGAFPDCWLQSEAMDHYRQALTQILHRELGDSYLSVLKDPRLCRLVPLLDAALDELGARANYVLPLRNPLEVAESLKARNGFPVAQGLLLWVRYLLEAEYYTRGAPRIFVGYDELLSDWPGVIRRIGEVFDLAWPRSPETAEAEVNRFLTEALKHQQAPEGELESRPEVTERVLEAYHTLMQAVQGRELDVSLLDDVRSWLTEADRLFLPIIKNAELKHEEAETERTRLAADLMETKEAQQKAEGRVEGLGRELEARGDRLQQVENEREELAGCLAEKERERERLSVELNKIRIEVQRERKLLSEKEHLLQEIWFSRSWRVTAPLRSVSNGLRNVQRLMNYAAWKAAKRLYWALPIPLRAKWRIRNRIRGKIHDGPEARASVVLISRTHPGDGKHEGGRSGSPAPLLEDFLEWECPGAPKRAVLGHFYEFGLPFQKIEKPLPPPDAEEINRWLEAIKERDVRRKAGRSPEVSIVIPAYNHIRYTLACIQALLNQETSRSYEIIVGDDCSTDGTGEALDGGVGRVRYLRNETNLGFIANCNRAASFAKGNFIVFLNNDTLVLPGWLDELIGTLERDPSIGLVGSKLLFPDGRLQEAGGIVWADATAWNYGRLDDPRRPEYSYMRDVDYCSGASIALPRKIWEQLGGFDDYFEFAYCEDVDLAFRVREEAGLRTVVQPLSMLIHFEGVTAGRDIGQGAKFYQVKNTQRFWGRWKKKLKNHRAHGEEPHLEKDRKIKNRVLVIDHITPEPDKDAGSVFSSALMEAFQEEGVKVTFVPDTNYAFLPGSTRYLQRKGVECIYSPFYQNIEEVLNKSKVFYAVALVMRLLQAENNLDTIRRLSPKTKIIFDTIDLHFLRELRESKIKKDRLMEREAHKTKERELYMISRSDIEIIHSKYEESELKNIFPERNPYVFPLIINPVKSIKEFNEREGVLFIGSFNHSPNSDAVFYFVREIWPKILSAVPDLEFKIVGPNVPYSIKALDGEDNIRVIGYVDDIEEIFGKTRITVAPLRFGAGIKGKVGTSLAHGVPCVATSMAAEGMGLEYDEEIFVADEEVEFSKKVIQAYSDEATWRKLSKNGVKFIEKNYSSEVAVNRVGEILSNIGIK